MGESETFVHDMYEGVLEIAARTAAHFGEERANQFSLVNADALVILFEIQSHYRDEQLANLVNACTWGLLKEFKWLQFHFLAGNYPLVKSRLRFIWEGVYRAYAAETHLDDRVRRLGPDEKLAWIEESRLNWGNCVEPTLKRLLPASAVPTIIPPIKTLWQTLNEYVHPSQALQTRLVGDSALLVKDNFDAAWAEETLAAGLQVADLVFLAVLTCHEKAIRTVAEQTLHLDYPLTGAILRRGCGLR